MQSNHVTTKTVGKQRAVPPVPLPHLPTVFQLCGSCWRQPTHNNRVWRNVKVFLRKSLNGYLVIGVNSDASAKRLKGEDRPRESLETRIANVKQYADSIVIIDDDPTEFIRFLSPTYIVKGADYLVEEVKGREYVRGGVLLYPLLRQCDCPVFYH